MEAEISGTGDYREWSEVDAGGVDEIFEWLMDKGAEFESDRSLWFNAHYVEEVMIDRSKTESQLLDSAANMTTEDLKKWRELYFGAPSDEAKTPESFSAPHAEVIAAIGSLTERQRDDWRALGLTLRDALGLPAHFSAAEVLGAALRNSYETGMADSLEWEPEPAAEVLDKGPSPIEVLGQIERGEKDGL